MDKLLEIVQTINYYLSDYILVIMLIGTGLYFSVKTRFVQVRCFKEGLQQVFGNFSLHGGEHKGGMTSFQALTTAIAAQVGTGNIVGACGAILIGGPGAIFWMWLIAFFGMATNYAEAVLALETRTIEKDGTILGGPVYYIKRAFKGKLGTFLAGFFAVAITLALGFMGSMVQSNSIGESCQNAFGILCCPDRRLYLFRRCEPNRVCYRKDCTNHGGSVSSRRSDRFDCKNPVCSGNHRLNLQMCVPAECGHWRRDRRSTQKSHRAGSEARLVFE